MNRRTFLTTLTAAAAGFALDPERLLWVPGQKTIFLPTAKQAQFLAPLAVAWTGGISPATYVWWRNRDPGEPLECVLLDSNLKEIVGWERWQKSAK